MKKFAAFLMILTVSLFTIGCGEGDKTPPADKTPAPADADKTPAGDMDKTPADTTPEGETTPE